MSEIKLFRPQRLTDNPDGGGLATATEIVDGEVNNLFDDISRIDRVNGELSLRKIFPIAATEDTELFADVHVIVQTPPLDERVSSVIFETGVWDDERADAQNYVERYLDPSVITRMIPYDRQLQGQRTVLVYQRPELSLPEIGEVYALTNDSTGKSEFFRVQDVDHEVQIFTDTIGDYRVRVIVLTISQPLTQEFSGSQPNRYFTVDNLRSIVRSTIASDAARYRGVVVLAEDASPGDLSIKVESIFAQLVPAATSEAAVVDAPPDGITIYEPAATERMVVNAGPATSADRVLHLPTAAAPGVEVVIGASPAAGDRWVEQPNGDFLHVEGIRNGAFRMNPERTAVVATNQSSGAVSVFVRYLPAASISKSAMTTQEPVEIQNRGYVYVKTLRPLPEPGTLVVSFRALGRWYTLRDDGTGALVGGPGIGSGSVNFNTGTTAVSLGALPDVGSSVIYSWGVATEYQVRTGDLDIGTPAVHIQLEAGNCEPGTLEVEWEAGGQPRSAVAAADGALSGDATGRVVHATGAVILRPSLLPDSNTLFSCTYEAGSTATEVFTPTAAGGTVVVTLSDMPRPGSLQLEFLVFGEGAYGETLSTVIKLMDDGLGGMRDEAGDTVPGASVVYATGVVTFPTSYVRAGAQMQRGDYAGVLPTRVAAVETSRYGLAGSLMRIILGPVVTNVVAGFINGTAVNVTYKADSAVDSVESEEHEPGPLRIDLTPRVRNSVVPGGTVFRLSDRTYYDRQGSLYFGHDPATGAGSAGGTIDYQSGILELTSYPGGVVPELQVIALLTEVAPLPIYVVHGRTPGSPLRPGTFSIRAIRASDGVQISASADNNGNVTSPDMHGVVDSVTGVFAVAFGSYVLDSSLSPEQKAESWYSADNVGEDGYIWHPREVLPGTIFFNCVVQVSLPMDPEIIKVNPVRLPMDGRVPVIRPGDTLVIHDPQPFTMPNGLIAGQVVALPRGGLASVAVYDQNGLGVSADVFDELDLVTGEMTLATPLDLSAYAQPLVAIHSVEDMALCLDAQLNGEIALGHALSHGYSAGNSLVSSAQILGDAQARYGRLFAQNTWTGVWSDDPIGAPPTGGGQFNDATFPIEVLNRDAITQRWRLTFTSPTTFSIIGEGVGNIGTGNTTTGAAPLNPATGEPYFEIAGAGFGAGWATGNTLRFNTYAAGGPLWVARTVRSGPATNVDDRIRLQVRWDKD